VNECVWESLVFSSLTRSSYIERDWNIDLLLFKFTAFVQSMQSVTIILLTFLLKMLMKKKS